MDTAEIIRELCNKKKMTLARLERELNFGNGTIAKASTTIRADRLKAIADYFGVSMEYLLTGETKVILTGFSVYRSITSSPYEVERLDEIDLDEHRMTDTVTPFHRHIYESGHGEKYDKQYTIQELLDMGAFIRYDFDERSFVRTAKAAVDPEGTELTDQERELLDTFRELNQGGRQKAMEYIKDLHDTGKYKKGITGEQTA